LHDKPNPYTVAAVFWSTVTAQLALNGNSFLFKRRDPDGVLDSLWILNPNAVRVKAENGQPVYEVSEGMDRREYSTDDITHIIGFSLDGITGVSRIEYCRQTFGAAIARDRYEGSFYRQGARVPGVIEFPGRLGEDGLTNMSDSFHGKHGGAQHQHK